MKKTFWTIIGLLGVFGGGLALGCILTGYQSTKVLGHFTYVRLTEMAFDMQLLRAGHSEKVLERYDRATPELLVQFDEVWSKYISEKQKLRVLWEFQRYYEKNPEVIMPEKVKPFLTDLPPRPLTSCEKKRLEEQIDPCTAQ